MRLRASSTRQRSRWYEIMAPSTRLFPGDEELGKRDDDHKSRTKPQLGTVWHHRQWLLRRNIKRIGLTFLALVAIYYFVKNMPTDLKQPSVRPSYDHSLSHSGGEYRQRPPPSEKTKTGDHIKLEEDKVEKEKHWYGGPIKFYELAASLYAIPRARGGSDFNQNVLFAASSLKSAATLLPIACEMAKWKRNDVHFALMGRDEISIKTLEEINGVTAACNLRMHDARPDYGPESTDFRMEISSGAALGHITTYMHPRAVIVDNSDAEEKYFLKGIKYRSIRLGRTLLELPANAEQSLMWLTRLDASSLNAYNKISIDILVHAQPSASGSLIRLLTSLKNADYFNSPPPRLTIELPHDVDEFATNFLANSFTWPPLELPVEGNAQQLTLRRRIPQHWLTAKESSIRFLESFWPANRYTSNVLVLSPQVELSPLYYHFLKYAVLEYKYSSAAATMPHLDLLGISLDLPSTYLNDTTPFTAPPNIESTEPSESNGPPFLWGSPSSNAVLYFGDKWTELHTLASHYIRSKSVTPNKRISTTFPSWLEYILTLSISRGYSILYPQLTAGDALATVHNELYQPPEEFNNPKTDTEESIKDDNFTTDPAQHLSLQHKEMPLARANLLNLLPADQLLVPLNKMPLLTWDGRQVDREVLEDEAEEFNLQFRIDVGGCKRPPPKNSRLVHVGVENLFCNEEDQVEEETDNEDQKSIETLESPSTALPQPTPTQTASGSSMDEDIDEDTDMGIVVGT